MGGRPAATSSRNGLFQLTLSHGLVDLGYVGASYTWCNGQHGSRRIKEQIGKGYTTVDWTSLFPHALVSHLPRTTLDHCLVLLQTVGSSFSGPKPLRFKQLWLKELGCKDIVKNVWSTSHSGSRAFQLVRKTTTTKKALQVWNRDCVGLLSNTIKQLHDQLSSLESLPNSDSNEAIAYTVRDALQDLLRKEETLWKSKSHVQWLATSDLNTRFFHISTIIRRCRNDIHTLKDAEGHSYSSHDDIGRLSLDHFTRLFTFSNSEIALH